MQNPGIDLSDSYARLEWVKVLAAQVATIESAVALETQRLGLACDELENDGWRYLCFKAPEVHVPNELGFLLADLVVNARSCLDMAMQRVVWTYQLPWKRPVFPIQGPQTGKGSRDRDFAERHLPPALWRAVQSTQPRDDWGPGGPRITAYGVAADIREMSNANKHRNLTPVLHVSTMHGADRPDDIEGTTVEWIVESDSPWRPHSDAIAFVHRAPAQVSREQMLRIEPKASFELLTNVKPLTAPRHLDANYVPIRVRHLSDRVPRYVSLALRNLEKADRWTRDGGSDIDSLCFDWDLAL